ncbi:MAG: hypothetical protein IBJ18_12930 [Phycisphaerales bacterium]|nr:hypothetical protein [Phycisphaerales bacterium]
MIRSIGKSLTGLGKSPRVVVGAFGKHPAWDDHIEDQGLATDELVEARRRLYADCIAGNINSGEWGKPDQPAPAWLVDFGHVFLWRLEGGSIIAGRLWPSRDGRKRTKYPMVVVAQCDNVGLTWIAQNVLPRLERLQQQCIDATSQEGVIGAVQSAQSDLSAAAPGAGPEDDNAALRLAMDRLLQCPLAEGTRTALYRVQYQLERELGGYLAAGRAPKQPLPPRGQHMRIPAAIDPPDADLLAWTRYVLRQIAPEASCFITKPLNAGWVDVSVGELSPQLVFPLRAGAEHVAPASEVPYTINDAFVSKTERLFDELQGKLPAGSASSLSPGVAAAAGASSQMGANGASNATNAPSAGTSTGVSTPAPMSVKETEPQVFGEPEKKPASMGVVIFAAAGLLVGAGAVAWMLGVFSPSSTGKGTNPPPIPQGPGIKNPRTGDGVSASPVNNEKSDKSDKADATKTGAGASTDTKPPTESPIVDPRTNWGGVETLRTLTASVRTLKDDGAPEATTLGESLASIRERVTSAQNEVLSPTSVKSIETTLSTLDAEMKELGTKVAFAEKALRDRPATSVTTPGGVTLPDRVSRLSAMNAFWRKQVDLIRSLEMTPQRVERIRSLQGVIESFERAMPKSESIDLPTTALGARVQSLWDSKCDKAAENAVAVLEQNLSDPGKAEALVTPIASKVRDWSDKAALLARQAARAEIALRTGASWREPIADGLTLQQIDEQIRGNSVAAEVAETLKPLSDQFSEMRAMSESNDRAALSSAIVRPETSLSLLRTAIDRGLTLSPAWPGDANELAAFAKARVVVRARLNEGRQDALDLAARNAWLRAWGEVSLSTEKRAELWALSETMGIKRDSLPAWAMFNLARHELETSLAGLKKADDASVAPLLGEFLKKVEPIRDRLPIGPAQALITGAATLSTRPPAPKIGPGDLPPAQGGTGRAKWTPQGDQDARGVVTYTLSVDGVPAQTIAFAPVTVNDKVVFISTTEISVGQAGAVLASAGRSAVFAKLVEDWNDFDTRKGLRTWRPIGRSPVDGGKPPLVPSATPSGLKGWLPSVAGAEKVAQPLADANLAGPDWNAPVQALPPEAALVVALSMNCRLPSAAEWKAAWSMGGQPDPAPGAQLRGSWFKKQHEVTKAARATGVMLPWQQEGAFWPQGSRQPASLQADEAVLPGDEAGLFFRAVNSGESASPFKHLMGNVAEFVLSENGKFDALAPDQVVPRSLASAQELRVIGGSAVSSVTLPRTEPLAVEPLRARLGFSDVGFRIAFGADQGLPQQVLAKEVKALLERAPALQAVPSPK